jgi:predicted  nucleic acid-binding Zn-ribbon protein
VKKKKSIPSNYIRVKILKRNRSDLSMEDTLKQILSELQKVNQSMDGFEKRFDNIDSDFKEGFDKLNRDIKELKDGQETIKDSIINRVGSYIEEVAKHIDEGFDGVMDTLEDQQKR